MSDDHRLDSQGQLFPDIWASWRNLGASTQSAEPFLKGVMRCNLELMGLASRRARAYLDIPASLQRCRSPQDLAAEQMRFWQTAAQDYAEGGRNLMQAWNATLSAGLRSNGVDAVERDYFNFTDRRADDEPSQARKQASRRAA